MLNDKYITFAVMINYILKAINDTFDYKEELIKLFEQYANIDFKQMGFEVNWKESSLWQ